MNTLIKTIEDLSLNAWPSHQIELYDGWILRFSYFYTHRTNSVEQIGPSTIPVEEKVQYCEEIYRRWGTPAIFKISPLVNPGFDAMLADRGYVVQHTTHVMTMDLANFAKKDPAVAVTVSSFIPPKWIDSLFALKSTTNVMHRMVVPSMYRAIPKETIVASIEIDGRMVASGLGILDRGHVGLYAIYVDASCRHKHYARAICSTILSEAQKKGSTHAYLQVVQGNAYAKSLYHSLGFEDLYTYWFRAKSSLPM